MLKPYARKHYKILQEDVSADGGLGRPMKSLTQAKRSLSDDVASPEVLRAVLRHVKVSDDNMLCDGELTT